MSWKLTEQERNNLSEDDRAQYDKAVRFKNHDWACGSFGGWVRGNNILKELGWKEQSRTEGHRVFTSLVKPI